MTMTDVHPRVPAVRLGLRENVAQFTLLVVVNAFVGAMVGIERSILPLLAEREFQLAARTAILSFIVVFGVTKAITNYVAGRFSDRIGRRHILIAGWLVAVPVPFLLMWAPTWSWVLVANGFLGISQGLTWSTTVIMKIDLVGPARRGLAMGVNEFAGYIAVAGAAWATGWIAAREGLRPEPFYLGVVFVAVGLALSLLLVRETQSHVTLESRLRTGPTDARTSHGVFWRTTIGDRNLSSISQAGLVNNLNDGMAWGLFPLFFAAASMSLERTAALAAIYPATWGLVQLGTGALSDRIGRKWLIATGHVDAGGRHRGSPPCRTRSSGSPWVQSFLASGPRWSTRHFWPALVTLPLPPGERQPSASIGSGETSVMRLAPSSQASPRISWAWVARCGSSRYSRSSRG